MSDGITQSDIVEYYNGRLGYMARDHIKTNGRHKKIKASLSSLIKSGMTVLDIGCGTGITSKHIGELGAKVTAIDIAPKLIEYAKEHSCHENIVYLVENAKDLDLQQQFDVIVLCDVFEHIMRSDIFQFVRRVTRYNTGEGTIIYLNIPDYNFLEFMRVNHPDKLQIIDEPHKMDDVVSLFAYCDFIPTYISIYGIDTDVQYNEYVFRRNDKLEKYYKKRLNAIYSKGEEECIPQLGTSN